MSSQGNTGEGPHTEPPWQCHQHGRHNQVESYLGVVLTLFRSKFQPQRTWSSWKVFDWQPWSLKASTSKEMATLVQTEQSSYSRAEHPCWPNRMALRKTLISKHLVSVSGCSRLSSCRNLSSWTKTLAMLNLTQCITIVASRVQSCLPEIRCY